MDRRFAWLGAAAGALAVWRWRRRKPQVEQDPAESLRAKLEESRAVVDEREEFESAETPVDQAEVDDRRRAVHERGRTAAERMRGDGSD
jgi:hypothetical protein